LVCLRQLLLEEEMTLGALARAVYLSQATVTGIIDRLFDKDLISRERSTEDRRKMKVRLTEKGARMANDMPWPLQ
jgi:DNA-binding MarR family transcriptional regulator